MLPRLSLTVPASFLNMTEVNLLVISVSRCELIMIVLNFGLICPYQAVNFVEEATSSRHIFDKILILILILLLNICLRREEIHIFLILSHLSLSLIFLHFSTLSFPSTFYETFIKHISCETSFTKHISCETGFIDHTSLGHFVRVRKPVCNWAAQKSTFIKWGCMKSGRNKKISLYLIWMTMIDWDCFSLQVT